MKTVFRLARFHLALHLGTSRFAMQGVALLLFVALLYAVAPAEAVSDFTLSAVFLFFWMVWAGFGMAGDPALEQLLALKASNAAKHHLGDALFLAALSAFGGVVAVTYPAAVNLFLRGGLYKLPLTVSGALQALALQCSAALLGGVTGWFFHPRVMPDRKLAALAALLLSVLGLVKPGIASVWAPLTYAAWLFPPLSDVALRLSGKAAFAPADTAWCCGALLLYACALWLIRWAVLVRRKY
jgi:hypothetical protein